MEPVSRAGRRSSPGLMLGRGRGAPLPSLEAGVERGERSWRSESFVVSLDARGFGARLPRLSLSPALLNARRAQVAGDERRIMRCVERPAAPLVGEKTLAVQGVSTLPLTPPRPAGDVQPLETGGRDETALWALPPGRLPAPGRQRHGDSARRSASPHRARHPSASVSAGPRPLRQHQGNAPLPTRRSGRALTAAIRRARDATRLQRLAAA